MESSVVTDENLRLVYSQQHESWLHDQIAASKRQILRYAIILFLGIGWLSVLAHYGPQWLNGSPDCVILKGGATLQQAVREGLVPAGAVECPPDSSGGEFAAARWSVSQILVGIASIFVLFFTMLSAAEGLRGLLKLRRYRVDIRDHHALLEKYGRIETPSVV